MRNGRFRNRGMTLIELMVVVAIAGILASVSLSAYRDYSRRAKMSEIVLATTVCKTAVSENYASLTDAPAAGRWGCESTGDPRKYVGAIQTSSDGVIRIAIVGMDRLVNGQYVYMIPTNADGTSMITPDHLGRNVNRWTCGSDWLPVRNAMPANCRMDTTTFSSQDYE
ncbi:MAG: prepilin-type N-terminal cleavage/methylation domain-containing protein [Ramlibacter sp.]